MASDFRTKLVIPVRSRSGMRASFVVLVYGLSVGELDRSELLYRLNDRGFNPDVYRVCFDEMRIETTDFKRLSEAGKRSNRYARTL